MKKKIQKTYNPSIRLDLWVVSMLIYTVYSPPIYMTVAMFVATTINTLLGLALWAKYDYESADAFEEIDELKARIEELEAKLENVKF